MPNSTHTRSSNIHAMCCPYWWRTLQSFRLPTKRASEFPARNQPYVASGCGCFRLPFGPPTRQRKVANATMMMSAVVAFIHTGIRCPVDGSFVRGDDIRLFTYLRYGKLSGMLLVFVRSFVRVVAQLDKYICVCVCACVCVTIRMHRCWRRLVHNRHRTHTGFRVGSLESKWSFRFVFVNGMVQCARAEQMQKRKFSERNFDWLMPQTFEAGSCDELVRRMIGWTGIVETVPSARCEEDVVGLSRWAVVFAWELIPIVNWLRSECNGLSRIHCGLLLLVWHSTCWHYQIRTFWHVSLYFTTIWLFRLIEIVCEYVWVRISIRRRGCLWTFV